MKSLSRSFHALVVAGAIQALTGHATAREKSAPPAAPVLAGACADAILAPDPSDPENGAPLILSREQRADIPPADIIRVTMTDEGAVISSEGRVDQGPYPLCEPSSSTAAATPPATPSLGITCVGHGEIRMGRADKTGVAVYGSLKRVRFTDEKGKTQFWTQAKGDVCVIRALPAPAVK